jgi:hypothetical protein
MKRLIQVLGYTLLAISTLLGCARELPPSAHESLCTATCSALTCTVNPDLTPEEMSRCESYCGGKFDASAEQGPSCEEAFTEAMSCLGELDCEAYTSWLYMDPGHECTHARSVVEDACEQIFLEPHILPP